MKTKLQSIQGVTEKRTQEEQEDSDDDRDEAHPTLPWDPWDQLECAGPEAGWWPALSLSFPGDCIGYPGIPYVGSGWVKRVVTCWFQTLTDGEIIGWWVVTLYSSDGSSEVLGQWRDDEWWGHQW